MRTFPLRIGTPDGLLFEGEVQRRGLPQYYRGPGNYGRTLQFLYGSWNGRGACDSGRRFCAQCSLHRRYGYGAGWSL